MGLGVARQPAAALQPRLGRSRGQALVERKKYVWWDEAQRKWTGHDVPDFIVDRPPSYRPRRGRARAWTPSRGIDPFIMQADGKGWLFAPQGCRTARCRRTTSRRNRRCENPLYGQQCNPARMEWITRPENPYPPSGVARTRVFPYVLTTYRLTEHHTAGGMSRWLPWLSELQPEMFCEVSPELAAERA